MQEKAKNFEKTELKKTDDSAVQDVRNEHADQTDEKK